MRVWGEGAGEGKGVEQQIGALGNPCSPFSSSSSLLCIRRGFDKNPILGSAIQILSSKKTLFFRTLFHGETEIVYCNPGSINEDAWFGKQM